MADLTKNIKIGVDASGVKTGVQESVNSIQNFGRTVQAESAKTERSTQSMITSIQRQTAATQAGTKGTAEYYENIAKLRGVSQDALRPYLEDLRKAQEGQDKAAASAKRWSDSTRIISNGLASLAAAFAGGAFFTKFITETINAEQEQAQLAAVLKSTGEAAGWSQEKLNDMAAALAKSSNFSAGEINQAQTRLLSYSSVVGQQFPRAMQAVVDMSQRMGMSVTQSAETIGKALDVPSEGLSALTKQGFRFTEQQKLMVEQLEASGQAGKAQGIILDALEASYEGAAAAGRDTLGGALKALQKSFDDVMTGDSGSIKGMREGIESLNATLSSESTRAGFQAVITGITQVMEKAVQAIGVLGRFSNAVSMSVKQDEHRSASKEFDRAAKEYGEFSQYSAADPTNMRYTYRMNTARERMNAALAKMQGITSEMGGMAGVTVPTIDVPKVEAGTRAVEQQSIALGKSSEWIRSFGTATEKANLAIAEWKKKLGDAFTPDMEATIRKSYETKNKGAAAAESAAKKEMTAYNSLVASIQTKIAQNQKEIDGQEKLTASQQEEIKLNEDLKSGKLKLTTAHEADIRARIAIAAAQEKAIETSKNEAAIIEQMRQIRMGMVGELEKSAQAYMDGNKSLEDEIALIGKTAAERTKMTQARNQEIILIKKATLAELERQSAITGTQTRAEAALREEIAQLERRNELLGLKDVKEEADEALKQLKQQYEQTIQQVEDIFVTGFADMMNNGKSGWDAFCQSLKTSFYTLVAKQIYKMLAEPFVINIVGNFLGYTGSAAAGAAGVAAASGGGMFSNITSGLSGANALGLLGTFGGGMSAGFGGLMGSLGLSTTGATFGGAMSAGSIAIGSGNIMGGLGTFFGALAPILGGLTLLFGGDLFGSLFGRKLKESGVEGTFGGDSGFEGRLYKYYKGGLFRSNKTTYEDMPEEMRSALGNQFLAMDESIRAMAGAVGLGGEALDGFTAKMKVNLKGLSEEEATKKLQEEFQKIADQMGALVLTTDEYTQAGETQLEALTRLSTSITLANEWFKAIGDTLYDVSLAGADMASELMDAFGGADKFTAATSNYYDKFYSDQEKVANQTRLLNEALKKLGVESMPTSRDALREYINGIDLSTEAGRKLYAAMIGLADSFDVVYTSAENIAAMKEDLNVQLLRAQGKDDEATKLERAKQLKELEKYKDPELVRMQVEVWNAEDKAKSDAVAKQAAEDLAAEMAAAQKAAKDLAMKNLEAALSREKEYWNQFSADAKDALTKASSYFDLVTNAAKSLRDSVEDSASWSAAAGMVYIEQALDRARKGGGLSDLDATKSAIEAATGGLVMDNYATQAELDYDKKVLAGQLDELGGYAELAKSDAQKQIDLANAQIKRLDDTLTFWKEYGEEQVDATMSVTDAVNALYKLLDPKEQERIRKEEAAKAGLDGGGTPGKAGSGATLGGTVSGTAGRYVVGFTADGRAKWSDGTVEKYAAGQSAYEGHLQVGSGNLTAEQWAAMQAGQSVYGSDWYFDEKQGLWMKRKSFAVGTNYVPYDMTANIHQGERIIPAADNRALMAALNTQGGGNAELITAVKKLEERLASIDHNTADVAVTNRRLDANIDQVSEGGNGLRVVNPG